MRVLLVHNPSAGDGNLSRDHLLELLRRAGFVPDCVDAKDPELEAVLAGLAYGQLPAYLAQPYLESGRLQAVLTEQAPDPWQLFIYRPQQGPVPPRVRLVFDHLRTCFSDPAQFPQG
mgnify:CR=1 FL=1